MATHTQRTKLTDQPELTAKSEFPEFAYRDIDHFFRKKHFFGPKTERTVSARFQDRKALEAVVAKLQENDFRNDDIFIAASHQGTVLDSSLRIVSIAPFLVPLGIAAGLILGALMGWFTQMGMLQYFGIQPFVNQSALIASAASGSVGGFVGGVLGLIYGMRIPEYQPWKYETTVPDGTLFLVVRTTNAAETALAKSILANQKNVSVSEELAA